MLALLFFSFSLESSTLSKELVLEDSTEVIKITVYHFIGSEGEYIVLELPLAAVPAHLSHGDTLTNPDNNGGGGGGCIPPAC